MTPTLLALSPPRRARGRPSSATIPAQRNQHLAVLLLKQAAPEVTNKALALELRVSRRTIQIWRKRAAAYPEAQRLDLDLDLDLADLTA